MVKAGYKETEIGVIPEDWEISNFGKVGSFYKGGGFSMRDTTPSGLPCIMYGDIYIKFNIQFRKCNYYINASLAQKCISAQPKNLLFTASGETAEDIGKCVSYQGQEEIFIGGDIIAANVNSNYNSLFLSYIQNSELLKKQKFSFAQGHSVVHINSNDIKKLLFPYPTNLFEQEKIAKALSAADNLIISLEKLIEKKKAIKQGAMQQLLTGKMRLPGFSGEWKIQESLFNFSKGSQVSSIDISDSYQYPMYNGGSSFSGYTKSFNCKDSIIISEGGNSCGFINYIKGKFWAGGHCYIVHKCKIYYFFLFQLLKYKQAEIMALRVGSGLPNIQKSAIRELKFPFPPTIKEQTAIADILSDMDNEISALEKKLHKYRQVKQGMMQELLTGKIRLVTPDTKETAVTQTIQLKGHNQKFDDAVVIGAIVDAFYSDTYTLGRKKVQKLLYFLRRKQHASVDDFKKKAAGPYADEVRYKGGEPIAIRNKYIKTIKTPKATKFEKGEGIEGALHYIDKWEIRSDLDWLVKQFKYIKTDKLELLATIDMAMQDLKNESIAISVATVKELIRGNKEWKAKLTKSYFSDEDIAWAIEECGKLFKTEE